VTQGSISPGTSVIDWFRRAPWRILLTGILLGLAVAALLTYGLMHPPIADVARLVGTLAFTSVVSVGIGYWLYRRGWTRSSSLTLTLMTTYVWAAVLTLFNVWVMQRRMFLNDHDLLLSGVLLLFAAIIATTYGLFAAASVTDGLRHLADAADRLAAGDLNARADVQGRDEVARLGRSFNDMAGELQAAADRQREVDQLRRNLIAWTSHDLRTPLTSIRVRVEALNDGLVGAGDQQRYLQGVRADVMALNSLIDDLFEMAQLEAGGLSMALTPSSLGDLISDCLESSDAVARQRSINLTGSVEPDVDPVALNQERMSRVLLNLCANAIRHAPEGGTVHVDAWRETGSIVVSVRDNGPGFAAADLPHVFEQFYRGEHARSRTTGGAGLGLAIARGIIEAHGGHIWAENGQNGGAIVSFRLPG
jgi:signal transduction histidine kinase